MTGGGPILSIHADRDALPPGMAHVAMLYPFWGLPAEHPEDPTHGRYDAFAAEGASFLALTSLEDADLAVFPAPWELAKDDPAAVAAAQRLARLAAEHGKPFVIFFWSDSTEPVPIEPSVVFRTSLHRSRAKPTELAMPAWSEDFLERYLGGAESVRPKRHRPVVGFCGHDSPQAPAHKALAKKLLGRGTTSIRGRALSALAANKAVDTNFVVRDRFFGGGVLASGELDYDRLRVVRKEYVRNMIESDYALAARGAGNFSYRLYEILSCGRLPLFVDTDCVLPFDRELDWKQFTVWVDESDVRSIGDRLAAFHGGLDDESFAELQHSARSTWVDYLSPQGFFRHFHLHFRRAGDGRLGLKHA